MVRYLVPTSKDFGDLVRGYRKHLGWTQAKLAQQAGLLPKTISAVEAGNGQVLLANVMRCLSALGVDLYLASRPQTQTPRGTGLQGSPHTEAVSVSVSDVKVDAPHGRVKQLPATARSTSASTGKPTVRAKKATQPKAKEPTAKALKEKW